MPTPDGAHCCWSGQVWTENRCVGIPSCPSGFYADPVQQSCLLAECIGGTIRQDDGVHCCFPGQGWHPGKQLCVGVPRCPADFEPRPDLQLPESCVRIPHARHLCTIGGGAGCVTDPGSEAWCEAGGYLDVIDYKDPLDSRPALAGEFVQWLDRDLFSVPARGVQVSSYDLNKPRAETLGCILASQQWQVNSGNQWCCH